MWKSGPVGCLDKGMKWFLGGEGGDHLRAMACSVGKDSRLTNSCRKGRPRSDMMKSATNGTVGTHDVIPVTEEENRGVHSRIICTIWSLIRALI